MCDTIPHLFSPPTSLGRAYFPLSYALPTSFLYRIYMRVIDPLSFCILLYIYTVYIQMNILYIYALKKNKMNVLGGAPTIQARRIIIITHSTTFCQEKNEK